jgi:diaminohydroxyphosphoribosylaminopyrimidine deaminase / 5-amino-6-(5-phosphoribosylamino)uracil reductase
LATTETDTDRGHLGAALALARRGLGRTWPNPSVGCVILDAGGRVRGRGQTQPGGRPHAETEALRQARSAAQGGTAYVTLEPCAHAGETAPCAEALIQAGIARCVVAIEDPDPRVAGRGLAMLRAAGIAVSVGLMADEAKEINAGFLTRIALGRPLVTLKLATTLDGRIATGGGESRWITGEAARAHGHGLRAGHDAILVGSGTAVADDPELTCRLPGLEERSPLRIVADTRLRLPLGARLVTGRPPRPTWLATAADQLEPALEPYRAAGLEIVKVARGADEHIDLAAMLLALGRRGLTRLLVEGGATLATALIKADLVDRIVWYRAAKILGAGGLNAIGDIKIDRLDLIRNFKRTGQRELSGDMAEFYSREL